MPGPAPKNPAVRQRRNRKSTRARLLTEEKPRQRAPSLPSRGEGEQDWDPLTVAWWFDVWHSPMAEEYVRSDVHALFRLAKLIDMFWAEPSKEFAAEIRIEQQAFGLTPLDRRRLEWTVERAEEAQDRARERRARTVPKRAGEDGGNGERDPRALLGDLE